VKATTEQIVSALRVLSVEMHSEDGVANAVVAEAADRLTLMANLVARHVQETKDDVEQMAVASETMVEATAKIHNLRARIKRLEDAGDAMASILNNTRKDWYTSDQCEVSAFNWNEAKEAKP
jgi:hypothetical protein